MKTLKPQSHPAFGEQMTGAHRCEDMVHALLWRRSTQIDMLGAPGPDAAILKTILTIAARVPDHRRVEPFRFITFTHNAREQAGDILADAYAIANPPASPLQIEAERARFMRAPVVVGVVSSIDRDHRTPQWEQILTAGAVCQNMLLAASAHGFAAQWVTEWYAYDRVVLEKFGVGDHENIAGFIYMGTATSPPKERKRPDIDALISPFNGSILSP